MIMAYNIVKNIMGLDIVEFEGKLGISENGELLTEIKFDEITLWPTSKEPALLCRQWENQQLYDINLRKVTLSETVPGNPHDRTTEEGYIVRYVNGKFGLEFKGREILPAVYDEVYKWLGCNVIYTRIGAVPYYYNTQGKQILTKVRSITDTNDSIKPYYLVEPQTNIIQTMDLTNSPIGDDFCVCLGRHTGLSRRTLSEHMRYIQQLSNKELIPQTVWDNTLAADDCYIYSASFVESKLEIDKALEQCIRKVNRLYTFEVSWSLIFNIIIPCEKYSELTIKYIKWRIMQIAEDNESEQIHYISIGTDGRLKNGLKMLVTRCVCDHCPSDEEYAMSHIGEKETFAELKDIFSKPFKNKTDYLKCAMPNVITRCDLPWNEHKKVLEFILSKYKKLPNNAILLVNKIENGITSSHFEQLVQWLINHGADINAITLGMTLIQRIRDNFSLNDNVKRERVKILKKLGFPRTKKEVREKQLAQFKQAGLHWLN
jgi:hypothetical protein